MLKLKLVETFPLKDGLVLSIILYLPVILLSVTLIRLRHVPLLFLLLLFFFFFFHSNIF